MEAYVATFIISTIPNLVLFFVPSSVVNSISATSYMLCFAAGALLGDVFLHSLPHLLGEEEHSKGDGGITNGHIDHHNHDRGLLIGGAVLAGFLAFMMSERLIGVFLHKAHDHNDHKKNDGDDASLAHKGVNTSRTLGAQGWLNLAADALHNFTDGIAIGVSYRGGKHLGFATLLSIFFHEIPHEFADFSILITNGFSKMEAIRMQFVTAIAAMIGAYVGTALTHQNEEAQDLLIAATSGGFVYIATIGVLADVMARNKQPSLKEIVLETFFFLLGVGLMVAVALTEEHAE